MPKSTIRKTPATLVNADRQSRRALDLGTAEPDVLGDLVRNAWSELSEQERPVLNVRLIAALTKAGANIRQHLLLLGIPAQTAEELTAPEIAALIRYVRINEPGAIKALAPVLGELLTAHGEPARAVRLRSARDAHRRSKAGSSKGRSPGGRSVSVVKGPG